MKTLNIYINNTKVEVEVDDDITEDEAEKIAEEISKDNFLMNVVLIGKYGNQQINAIKMR